MWYRPQPFELGGSDRAHLKVQGLSAGYGAFLVLRDIELDIRPGLTVVLGPNGAGKTTLLKALNGLIRRQGDVRLNGADLPEKTHEIVQAGVALVPEGRQLFPQLTVTENLELGGWLCPKAERARRLEQAFADFPKLRERAQQLAGTMSGGEQQMLAIGRALMSKPNLLLLDEPSLGLAPIIIQQIFDIIEQLRKDGVTVFLVEQNANQALKLADRGYVLENGHIVMRGSGEELLNDPKVRDAYLGG